MDPSLQRTFDSLESQRLRVLNEMQKLPAAALLLAPPGKWSALRILSHIIAGERGGLDYVRKKSLGIKDAGNIGLWGEFKVGIFIISQRLPMLKYKAPRVIEERTRVYEDLATIGSEWEMVRSEWQSFLEQLPEQYVRRKIFRHVVGGRFSVKQGLVIFREHINHHLPQIRERVKHVDKA